MNKVRDKIRTVELDYMRRPTRRDTYNSPGKIKYEQETIWKEMGIKTSITSRLENKAWTRK